MLCTTAEIGLLGLLIVLAGCIKASDKVPQSPVPVSNRPVDSPLPDKLVRDAFVEQAGRFLFKDRKPEDVRAYWGNCEFATRKIAYGEAAENVTNALTDPEQAKSAIRFGKVEDLKREGNCLEVTASQYPWTACGYLDDNQKLIFLWTVPEG